MFGRLFAFGKGRMNILLIENEEFFAQNLCDYLRKSARATVQCVSHVHKALDLLAKNKFDLVVSELRLPDTHSEDWLLEIGKINPKQKLIIISSYQMPKNLTLTDKLNIIGYYEKPFDAKIIANLIQQLTN
jgi:DNA-binding NarL/FixJ family response regulator